MAPGGHQVPSETRSYPTGQDKRGSLMATLRREVPLPQPRGSNERVIPLRKAVLIFISIGIGVGGTHVPEVVTPAILSLAAFNALNALDRMIR